MHKNWVIKVYDQSVTCLDDDMKTLVTRSRTLPTLETLSQTNNSIHKHSSRDARGKLQIRRSKSEIATEEIRSEKRINQIGATKLKLQSKEPRIQIC